MDYIWNQYRLGKSVDEIAKAVAMNPRIVEQHLLRCISKQDHRVESCRGTILETSIAMSREERIQYIRSLSEDEYSELKMQIHTYFIGSKHRHYEDVVAVLWIIGELELDEFAEILCMHTASKNGNIQRIAYSSMGKLYNMRFIPYLKMGCRHSGIQIRMYAIKALSKYKFDDKSAFFQSVLQNEKNPKNQRLLIELLKEMDTVS